MIQYTLATGCSRTEIEAEVDILISYNWKPHGGICVVPQGNGTFYFYQAMTKE
jgi:hypothetical protein